MRDDQLVAIVSIFLALILAVGKYRGIQGELRRRDASQSNPPGQPDQRPLNTPNDKNP